MIVDVNGIDYELVVECDEHGPSPAVPHTGMLRTDQGWKQILTLHCAHCAEED